MAAASHYVFVFMENFQSINYTSQNTLSGCPDIHFCTRSLCNSQFRSTSFGRNSVFGVLRGVSLLVQLSKEVTKETSIFLDCFCALSPLSLSGERSVEAQRERTHPFDLF
jgi:hypothetical protein